MFFHPDFWWLFEMNLGPARNNTFIPAEDCQWMMRVGVDWKLCMLGNYFGRRPKFGEDVSLLSHSSKNW